MQRPVTAAELFDDIGAGYEEAFGRPPVVETAIRQLVESAGLTGLGTHVETFQPDKPGAQAEEHLLITARR